MIEFGRERLTTPESRFYRGFPARESDEEPRKASQTRNHGPAMPEDMECSNFDEESWRQIEADLRAGLLEEGLPVEQVDWICRDMKPRYLLCCSTGAITIDAPPEYREAIEDAIERTGAFFGAATARLLVVMAKLEAELYDARFRR